MQTRFLLAFVLLASAASSQPAFPKHALSVNGFRNPSIGLEYQHQRWSVHGGYYVTNFTSGVTTAFVRAGISYWWLPVGKGRASMPSSFYSGVSYLRGLTRSYRQQNAYAAEIGFRYYVWRGLNARLGLIALAARHQPVRFNPTPAISYSFRF